MTKGASKVRTHLAQSVFGLWLGYSLSRIGFADFAEVHRMFTFADLRLFLTFIGALAFAMAGFAALKIGRARSAPLHPSVAVGGVLFGAGWAVTGTCPGIALVQLGEGRLWALATLSGVVAGTWLYARVHERYFRWSARTCAI